MSFKFPPKDIMVRAVDALSEDSIKRIRKKYAKDKMKIDGNKVKEQDLHESPLNQAEFILFSVIVANNLYTTICLETENRHEARQKLLKYFNLSITEVRDNNYIRKLNTRKEIANNYQAVYNLLKDSVKGNSFNRMYCKIEQYYSYVNDMFVL